MAHGVRLVVLAALLAVAAATLSSPAFGAANGHTAEPPPTSVDPGDPGGGQPPCNAAYDGARIDGGDGWEYELRCQWIPGYGWGWHATGRKRPRSACRPEPAP
jgi:hypothetical protein